MGLKGIPGLWILDKPWKRGHKPSLLYNILYVESLILPAFFKSSNILFVKTCFAFTNKRTDGDNSINSFWLKAFLEGTRWLREGPESITAVDYPWDND